MKDARFVVHVAGDPHEGLQACRQCASVLVEYEGDSNDRDRDFFPAGAFVTIGPGCAAIGMDARAISCRTGEEALL